VTRRGQRTLRLSRRLLTAITTNLIERNKADTFDNGDMDEYVSAAVLRLNESIALCRVELLTMPVATMASFECTNVIGVVIGPFR
jgi:hypothetical protein